MLRSINIVAALFGLFATGVHDASAACTSETFNFDDGTMQGWSSYGTYSASNSGGQIHISGSGAGCELNGMLKTFDGGDSLNVYYNWESNAFPGFADYSNQSFNIRDGDTSVTVFGEYTHCGHCGDPGPSASGFYTNTITSEIEGISNLQVIIGLYDCWGGHHGQTNTIDNVTIEICHEDVDEDGFKEDEGDCDDFDDSIYPGATEVCDEIDNDCDGEVDEDDAADAPTWYADSDDDGFGDAAATTAACEQPSGFVGDDTDCNDESAETWPGATEYCDEIDNDCDGAVDEDDAADASTWYADSDDDGFGDPDSSTEACEQPSGFVGDNTDCNDESAETWPSATEYCDGDDNDCDGVTDEDDAADASTWFRDGDSDGYGDADTSTNACDVPAGYVSDDSDCDDSDDDNHPGATEYCDGDDNNCDGVVDEDDAEDAATWYADSDSDGYGDADTTALACSAPEGHVGDSSDCDDAIDTTFPGADETCDGDDNDCDGVVDEDDAEDATTWHADSDSDGYGDADTTTEACDVPDGYVSDGSDCDDSDDDNFPGAAEYCDGEDNDCDGVIDNEALDAATWYADADADGYGDTDTTTDACSAPEGHVEDSSDCDDAAAATFPDAAETCDGIDNDCDGVTDEDDAVDAPTWYIDHDSDGYGSDDYTWVSCEAPDGYIADATDCDDHLATTSPDADEFCDDVDNDCDGAIDEDAVDMVASFADTDEDGFGDAESVVWACSTPEGHVKNNSDCDDSDPASYPGAPGWTLDCEAIVGGDTGDSGEPGDTGDSGEPGDTGEPLDTGDVQTEPEDTGPIDTGADPEDDPGDDPGEGLDDSPDDDTSVIDGSNKGCSCSNGQRNPMAPWLLVFVLVGAARLRTRP